MSRNHGEGWSSLITLSFNGFRSTHICTCPVFFGKTTISAHQGVASLTFEITFSDSIRLSSLTFARSEGGTHRGV